MHTPTFGQNQPMNICLFSLTILAGLALLDLMIGVSNDAVNFLNSSIGSRVAPRHVIMTVASIGILAGVTFSSGMMEVARKGIFHPKLFRMPELLTIFLAVMLTDIILLDLFNTFGLPTSTTVSIVFELLGAAVALSLIKIHAADESFAMLVNYINTGKALAIISGILLSVVIAFLFGALAQFVTRLVFTFDYRERLKRYGGIWGGIALSIITYFIMIKGARGTSFLTEEVVLWVHIHRWELLGGSFLLFSGLFQLLVVFTTVNILKPVVLAGTFALAMAFAANDLVNFIGVPLAGLSAYTIASRLDNPLTAPMEALQGPIQSNSLILLVAGATMVITLWVSKKARTVTRTEVSLGRQEEGIERFDSSALSRIVVRMAYTQFDLVRRITPIPVRRIIANRMAPEPYGRDLSAMEKPPSFDLLRASVNLIVASAVISFATSMKLPLSTTYVTFMVAMGTSLSDQAWGRESAVYRLTGVLTVIGGWFMTALFAFSAATCTALVLHFFKLPAILGILALSGIIIVRSHYFHFKREKDERKMESLSLKHVPDADTAMQISFEQTGYFLTEISDSLDACFDAVFLENRQRLKDLKIEAEKVRNWSGIIIANIFKTLFLLHKENVEDAQNYSHAIRALRDIADSHMDILTDGCAHFENNHRPLLEVQKDELRQIKTALTRLLRNTGIMLLQRKKVDYDYILSQTLKFERIVDTFDKNQIKRIQTTESKTRLSILFYSFMENSMKIFEQTRNLLDIFRSMQ